MAGKISLWYANQMKKNLRLPQKGIFGWIASQYLIKRNRFLEENAVRLCNIQPDHQVLEIGFGPGIGLETAYNVIKMFAFQMEKEKLYGVETSLYMVELTSKRLSKALEDKKMMLFHGSASNIPLNTDSVHRVFHCNSYYFWPSMRSVLREIYRVMKPGGIMVTTLCLENLKQSQKKGFLNRGVADPVKYMVCLENFGFENVHIEYHKDAVTGKEFQAIFSEVIEKPAHDSSLYSDDEDDEIEKEVERLFKSNDGDLITNSTKNNT